MLGTWFTTVEAFSSSFVEVRVMVGWKYAPELPRAAGTAARILEAHDTGIFGSKETNIIVDTSRITGL